MEVKGQTEIKGYLESEFSKENISYYAEACRDTAWKMIEMIMDRGREPITVLIPSRGAVPFIIGAIKAIKEDPEINKFVKEAFGTENFVELPNLSCFDVVRDTKEAFGKPLVRMLLLPFTADVSFYGEEAKNKKDLVGDMRRFMTRVASEILFKAPHERVGKEFQLYLNFLNEVEGRRGLAQFYGDFQPVAKGEPVLYIDTVISGRASDTIIGEFERLGVNVGFRVDSQLVPLLVVDNYGLSLGSRFRRYVDQFSATKSVLKVPKILSEDKGAAFLGITAVIYENLITTATNSHPECGDLAPCFGAWHDVPSKDAPLFRGVFKQFIELIGQRISGQDEDFTQKRREFLSSILERKVLETRDRVSHSEIKEFFRRGLPFESARETGSHIIQIRLPDNTAESIVSKVCRLSLSR